MNGKTMRGAGPFVIGVCLALGGPAEGTGKPAAKNTAGERAPGRTSAQTARARGAGTWDVVHVSGDVSLPGARKQFRGSGRMLVYLPVGYGAAGPMPLVVALHGWGHTPEHWRDKSVVAELADRYGVVVACPDMGRTVYETRFFPETTGGWGSVPGTPWLLQVVIPWVRMHYDVRAESEQQAILGYSTGGRGAVVALEHGADFGFCASLSGTYDLTTLAPGTGEYKIHAVVYGERAKFPERWCAESSLDPAASGTLLASEVFVAHGTGDRVVDVRQAGEMVARLKAFAVKGCVDLVPGAGHDWAFWNSALPTAFAMFNRKLGERGCTACQLPAEGCGR